VLRFFETDGAIRRAITAIKKKHGPHRNTIHELTIAEGKIDIDAQPLRNRDKAFVPGAYPFGTGSHNSP
jgi:hypothetical protein